MFDARNFPFVARFGAATLVVTLAVGSSAIPAPATHPSAAGQHSRLRGRFNLPTPIQHVIVIVQENRSVDNLFHGYPTGSSFPGLADTVYKDSVTGNVLQPCSLYEQNGCPGPGQNPACGLSHNHIQSMDSNGYKGGFAGEYDFGKMDGFQTQQGKNCTNINGENPSFSFVPPSEVTQYWGFAQQYALVDHALQTNSGPSFPAHQYLIAGQAAGLLLDGAINTALPWSIDENAVTTGHTSCLSPNAIATAVDLLTPFPGTESESEIPPCNSYPTILDELPASGTGSSWRYYANAENGLWGGPSAVSQDCKGINPSTGQCNNPAIINCSPQALKDFLSLATPLPSLTFVMPESMWSDHPVSVSPNAQTGPNWVTWLVNTIGESSYWKNTTIIVTWDDWGGWYDHYQPGGPPPNQSIINCATGTSGGTVSTPGSCGFRVPMIVIGPYVKTGYVDSTATNAAGAILLYIEHTFGLPLLTGQRSGNELGSADNWTNDDLMNTMNFNPSGFHQFVPQPTTTPASYYTNTPCHDPGAGVD